VRYVWNWRQIELSLKLFEQAEGVHYEESETASSGLEPFDATVCKAEVGNGSCIKSRV
jgi:hypothetical protein